MMLGHSFGKRKEPQVLKTRVTKVSGVQCFSRINEILMMMRTAANTSGLYFVLCIGKHFISLSPLVLQITL